ncbi:MAG: hypothetical protein H7Y41_07150, partial [Hyphomonadaceae bacterium]|nr:hypothetical protein [Clostridia bacterium]
MQTKLEYFYIDNRVQAHYQEWHNHHCYELVYYTKGQGNTNIDGVAYTYAQNYFSLMLPDCSHNRHHKEETEFIVIGFLYNLPIELLSGVYLDQNDCILNFMTEMKNEMASQNNHYQIRLNALTIEIIVALNRIIFGTKKEKEEDYFIY